MRVVTPLAERIELYKPSLKIGAIVGVGIALLSILFMGAISLHRTNEALRQSQQNGREARAAAERSDAEQKKAEQAYADRLNKLQAHLDCLLQLDSMPNHQYLTISDIQNCKIVQTSYPSSSSSTTPQGASPTSPSHTATPTPAPTPDKTTPPTTDLLQRSTDFIKRLTGGLL